MRYLLLVLALATALAACSNKDESINEAAEKMAQDAREKVDEVIGGGPPQSIDEAIQRVGDALSNGEQSASVEELKALLPEELIGLDRVSHEAKRMGVVVKVSRANAAYGDGEERLSLMITDLGGAGGLASMSREMFAEEVDREDENGFERTTTYKGHKSIQRMQTSGDKSIAEIMVFVDDRFTVQLDGQNVSYKRMIKALDQIDIDTLMTLQTAAK